MRWWLTGIALVSLHLALLALSRQFGSDFIYNARLGLLMSVMGIAAGTIYVILAVPDTQGERRASRLVFMVLLGVVMRACLFPSTPMLETDYWRYLWDGGVTANGHNPYVLSPAEARQPGAPEEIARLAREAGPVLDKVNHPDLRTVYPPVAQGAFALAHWIAPWRLEALVGVFALCDVATLVLLFLLLRQLGLPLGLAAVYWWNPILIKEVYNSCHMDVVILPFVVGAVLLAVQRRHTLSVIPLALATGAKVWPVLLLPVLVAPLVKRPTRLALAVVVFLALVAVLFLPIVAGGLDANSGFRAYGSGWEMNDAAYMVLAGIARSSASIMGLSPDVGRLAARLLAALVVVGVAALAARRPVRDGYDLCSRVLLIVAVLFMVSPTQFPWYFLWMLPFLAIRPNRGLLLLSVVLWMYYWRYFWDDIGHANIFHNGLVWLEYAPVFLMLGYDAWRGRKPTPEEAI